MCCSSKFPSSLFAFSRSFCARFTSFYRFNLADSSLMVVSKNRFCVTFLRGVERHGRVEGISRRVGASFANLSLFLSLYLSISIYTHSCVRARIQSRTLLKSPQWEHALPCSGRTNRTRTRTPPPRRLLFSSYQTQTSRLVAAPALSSAVSTASTVSTRPSAP